MVEPRPERSLPSSTYRLQLHAGFDFAAAAAIVPYLADLGVSHLYLSPVLQAVAGSTHGYDVVDHHLVNEELGGEAAFQGLAKSAHNAGLGVILDIVPNHMAISERRNRWWWDVLENGPSSIFAFAFDVDWDPPEAKLRNTVLLPVLGDHYGRELEAGRLRVARDGALFTVGYFDHVLPAAPRTLDSVLADAASRVAGGCEELESIGAAFGRLPKSTTKDRVAVRQRHRDKSVLRVMLERLCNERPEVAAALDAAVDALNADFDQLDVFLERQNYRLAFWRTAGKEVDYRRFFDITTLVGMRVEDEAVFSEIHELVLGWVADGIIDGLRIDHVDGLRDPAAYLNRLAEATSGAYVVVEKILAADEELVESWPVAGTTGYNFLRLVGGLFVDPSGERPLTGAWQAFSGDERSWDETVVEAKGQVMADALSADVARLTELGVQVCERHRCYRDYTRDELRSVIEALIASIDVYRTYVVPAPEGAVGADEAWPCSEVDRVRIEGMVTRAITGRPELDRTLVDFLGRLLTATPLGGPGFSVIEAEFVARFQQVTSPVMAKASEDTAGYRFMRLLALNDVGCDPSRFGVDVGEFHAANALAQRHWPSGMLASSTHDTKRSEDVRARLALLSEIPTAWSAAVTRWSALAEIHRVSPELPDRSSEWLLYQTLVGAWPVDADRLAAYMEKAAREAKQQTSWVDPDPAFEEALRAFVSGLLADKAMMADVDRFVQSILHPGRVTTLAQHLLKLTSPGVPDLYQGTELWNLSLVDPDNRRPVDYDECRDVLATCRDRGAVWALGPEGWGRGAPKAWLTACALDTRRRQGAAFAPATGAYEPLLAVGSSAKYAVGFLRGGTVISIAPRLVVGLARAGGWSDTVVTLPEGEWVDAVWGTGTYEGSVELARLLPGAVDNLPVVEPRPPVALLVRQA